MMVKTEKPIQKPEELKNLGKKVANKLKAIKC